MTELSIRDGEGRPATERELFVRTPAQAASYWNDPAESAEVFVDGWVRTRDLARLDSDGYLHLLGRIRDVGIVQANLVYAGPIERILAADPTVAEAYVVGRPDDATGGRCTRTWCPPPVTCLMPGGCARWWRRRWGNRRSRGRSGGSTGFRGTKRQAGQACPGAHADQVNHRWPSIRAWPYSTRQRSVPAPGCGAPPSDSPPCGPSPSPRSRASTSGSGCGTGRTCCSTAATRVTASGPTSWCCCRGSASSPPSASPRGSLRWWC
ncbi:hypothetical protein V2I01_29925 [Micromonospora sp. BRA006-A]|nr:hypothetical protein [Micromonospora sp. BRA006-A]